LNNFDDLDFQNEAEENFGESTPNQNIEDEISRITKSFDELNTIVDSESLEEIINLYFEDNQFEKALNT